MNNLDVELQDAETLIERGKLHDGRVRLGVLRTRFPESIEVMIDLAVVEMFQGNIDAAERLLLEVLAVQPENEIARENLALVQAKQQTRLKVGAEKDRQQVAPSIGQSEAPVVQSGKIRQIENLLGDYTSRTHA